MALNFNMNIPKKIEFNNNNNVRTLIYNNEIVWEEGYVEEFYSSFPIIFNTQDAILKNYKVYGNSNQNADCGDKTSNLYDKTKAFGNVSKYISANGNLASNSGFNVTGFYGVAPNTNYMLEDVNISSANPAVCFYDENKEYISGIAYNKETSCDFKTPANCYFIKFSINKSLVDTAQLHLGNTSIPYEPFGYKIPININNIIIPIYLDEPLRKINDVSDYIDFVKQKRYTYINNGQILQTPVEKNIVIPEIDTNVGNNSLNFDTVIKPSKVYIKYKTGNI